MKESEWGEGQTRGESEKWGDRKQGQIHGISRERLGIGQGQCYNYKNCPYNANKPNATVSDQPSIQSRGIELRARD